MNGFAALDIPPCRRYVVVKATAGFAVCRLILNLLLFYSCLDFTQNLGETRIRKVFTKIILTFGLHGRTDTVIAVPVDISRNTFRVDMLAVGNFKTAVIMLWIVSTVLSGASVVSCQFQRSSLLSDAVQRKRCAGAGETMQRSCKSAACNAPDNTQ